MKTEKQKTQKNQQKNIFAKRCVTSEVLMVNGIHIEEGKKYEFSENNAKHQPENVESCGQ